jgi:hypothetical protein
MNKVITLLGLIIVLTSCAHFTGEKMSRISPGMSKADVIRYLREPKSIGGGGGVEVLHYEEEKPWWQRDYYFVRLVDGKVESYGPESKDHPVSDSYPPLKSAK